MEKYEFRAKQPLWIWLSAVVILGCTTAYALATENYFLVAIWLFYFVFLVINTHRRYIITPDSFAMKVGFSKPRTFSLDDITEIEKKYTKNRHVKSAVVRYSEDKMHHNFLELRRFDTDVEGILDAILDYRPSVPVH